MNRKQKKERLRALRADQKRQRERLSEQRRSQRESEAFDRLMKQQAW
jgi:hypothetical protein